MSPSDRRTPTESPLPDEAQEAASRAGAIETLFREHNRALVRFLAARLSSDAEAREVAQEAYVGLLQLDQPQAVGFLRAFLFKTASNIAIDRLRRRRLAKAAYTADPLTFDADQLSPEAHVADAEEIEIVAACLQELAPRCRQAVLLSRIEGKTSSEVAAELGISARMVRKYVAQAVLLIRDRLETLHIRNRGNETVQGGRT